MLCSKLSSNRILKNNKNFKYHVGIQKNDLNYLIRKNV